MSDNFDKGSGPCIQITGLMSAILSERILAHGGEMGFLDKYDKGGKGYYRLYRHEDSEFMLLLIMKYGSKIYKFNLIKELDEHNPNG